MIKIKDLLIVQFITWSIFMVLDWIEELFSVEFWIEVCFGFPLIIGILYFIIRKNNRQIKQIAILLLKWFSITISVTFIITALVINRKWIIPQNKRFLDGLEYTVFGSFLLTIPIAIVLIGEFIIRIFKKNHTKLKE